MKNDIRVVVVDDHHLTRVGIINLIDQNPKVKVVGEGWAGNHIFALLEQHEPDMLVTDLQMPAQAEGEAHLLFEPVSSLQKIKQRFPTMTIIVITQEDDIQTIQSLAEIGVNGYFLKSDDSTTILPIAIEMVHLGGTFFSPEVKEVINAAPKLKPATTLTERHLQVLNAIIRSPAATRAEQAQSLDISENTLQKHITQIFSILNVPNMESCILKALRMRLVHNPTIIN